MPSDTPNTAVPLAEISQGPNAFESFLDRNQIGIIALAILLALATVAGVIYNGVTKGLRETAGAALAEAKDLPSIQAIIKEHEGTPAAASAMVLLAEKQWSAGQQQEAVSTLESFLASHADHPAAATAKASLATKLATQGKSADALAKFQEIVDAPESRHLAGYALVWIGDIARAAGETAKAEAAYQRVVAEFSDSEFLQTATLRLKDVRAKAPIVIEPPAETPEATPAKAAEPTSQP